MALDFSTFFGLNLSSPPSFRRTWASTWCRETRSQATWAPPASSPPPSWRTERTPAWPRCPSWAVTPSSPSGRSEVRTPSSSVFNATNLIHNIAFISIMKHAGSARRETLSWDFRSSHVDKAITHFFFVESVMHVYYNLTLYIILVILTDNHAKCMIIC